MAQAKEEAAIEQEQAVVEVAAQAVAAAKQEAAARQEKAVAEAVAEAVAQAEAAIQASKRRPSWMDGQRHKNGKGEPCKAHS